MRGAVPSAVGDTKVKEVKLLCSEVGVGVRVMSGAEGFGALGFLVVKSGQIANSKFP